MKLCKDCKHVRREWFTPWGSARCAVVPAQFDMGSLYVDGESGAHCRYARAPARPESTEVALCGPDGKLWEAKP